MNLQTPLIRQLTGAAMASALGTALDYGVFLILIAMGIPLTPAVVAGGLVGAAVNFLLARTVVFQARGGGIHGQAVLFAVGAIMSIFLNAVVVNGLVIIVQSPALARAGAIIAVAALFNFPFQKWVVFRPPKRNAR